MQEVTIVIDHETGALLVEDSCKPPDSLYAGLTELLGSGQKLANEFMMRRRKLKLTQGKLARISGIGQAEINKIEGGHSNPTLDTLSALAQALLREFTLTPLPSK